jgi:TorA maturation chaperone TorD
MSIDQAHLERAVVPATAARLLAAWWSPPTDEELARWAFSWETARALRLPGVDELHAAFETAEPSTLRAEHERLLVGPGRTPCSPYESLWRTDAPRREQGRLMAACAADVARIYGELGLQVRPDAHELPDHLVIELEAFAYAVEHGAEDGATALLHEHLNGWVAAFCAAIAAETDEPFYAELARVTPEWLTALAA